MEPLDFSQLKPDHLELTPEDRELLKKLQTGDFAIEYKGVLATLDYYSIVTKERREWWIVNPNRFFKGESPADLILTGRGGYLRDVIESTAAGTFF